MSKLLIHCYRVKPPPPKGVVVPQGQVPAGAEVVVAAARTPTRRSQTHSLQTTPRGSGR